MMFFKNQKELFDFIKENNPDIEFYFEEVRNNNADYIYLRRNKTVNIKADNISFCKFDKVDLQVYCKDTVKRNGTCKSLQNIFNCNFDFTKDKDSYVAVATVTVFVGGWND